MAVNNNAPIPNNRGFINVNDADSIFVPFSIEGDRSDYLEYKVASVKVAFHRTIPENSVLVKMNRFTGRLKVSTSFRTKLSGLRGESQELKTGGGRFLNPIFTKSILVPIMDRDIDYPRAFYDTSDGIHANVDIALKVKITDPILYLKYGRYQLAQLNILTQNLLRTYIKSKKYDELSSGRISLNEFDPVVAGQNGGNAQSAYDDFEKRYGIKVETVQLKDIKLPPNMQKIYDDKKEAEKRKEAQQVQLEAAQEKALAEAKILKIRAEAEAERNKKLIASRIQGLIDSGVSPDRINEELGTIIATGSPNANVIVGGNSRSNDVAAGVVVGQNISQKRAQNVSTNGTNKTRVQILIELVQSMIQAGIVDTSYLGAYQRFINSLRTNQELIKLVNGFSEDQFKQVTNSVLSGEFVRNFMGPDSNSNTKKRN